MSKELYRPYGSKPSVDEAGHPFTIMSRYDRDVSDYIARYAILTGNNEVLNKLAEKRNIYYWLPEENGQDVSYQFLGITEDGERMFYRFKTDEKVEFNDEKIEMLKIQHILTDIQILEWGALFNAPSRDDVIAKQKV